MKIHKLGKNSEYWYDRSCRCWWGRLVDSVGNQIGDAHNAYTAPEIIYILKSLDHYEGN